MEIFTKYKNFIVIGVVVVLAFVGYNFFFVGNDSSLLTASIENSANGVADRALLTLLIDLKSIELDESIFDDQAFKSLRDFGRDLTAEPVGRENPFAPRPE